MKLLALLTSSAGTRSEQLLPYAAAEGRRMWELYAAGLVEEAYQCRESDPAAPCAMLILHTRTRADGEALLASLPTIKAGLLTGEITVLGPLPEFAAALAAHDLPPPPWWPPREEMLAAQTS